jgi:hypothetical protein|nr:MAG TPA: transcriptional repressor [Caudoviricetes sp.]
MISKYKERITVSLNKTNIAILEYESEGNNQTKSEFIDSLITDYANNYLFKRVVEINIMEKLKELGFNCTRSLNMKIDHDKIMIKTNCYYNNNMVSIIAESTFDFKVKILKSIKRAEIYTLED